MKILSERPDGTLELLDPEPFPLEVHLQELLETHPSLVLTDTVDDQDRRIWTIGWEVGVEAGSIDLLLLDSTARVWVVETKLATNSEIKKQVVGQVLGYASCTADWTADDLVRIGDTYLERRVSEGPGTLVELLTEGLGDEEQAQNLLEEAADSLSRGDLTALIVVDEIPAELRRLVEWVNGHASFELLAMKIEVIPHDKRRLFIPTVVGASTVSRLKSGRQASRQWDEASFFAELDRIDPDAVANARRLYDWVHGHDRLEISFGSGMKSGSVIVFTSFGDTDWVTIFTMWTSGSFGGAWTYRPVHQNEKWWVPFIEVVSELSGKPQSPEKGGGFPISSLSDSDLDSFQRAVLELIDRIETATTEG
jgi:hypothetical protein